MRFTRGKPQHGIFDIVVTSMLDINFLLIMFFMMTAHFQQSTHALLDLPQERGEAKAQVDEAGLVINLLADGTIVVSNETVGMDQLRKLVQAQTDARSADSSAPLKLMVRADRNASTGQLNTLVTMLRQMGVGTVRIATEEPR
jgi:biopolymer transport protein ExbD